MFDIGGQMVDRIGIRLRSTDKELLNSVCEARGENISNFVRRAIRRELASLSYLTEDEKKALGIKVGKEQPQRTGCVC